MFQIRWTKKPLLSLAETLEYWNIHNSSETYSLKLRIEIKKKEKEIAKNPRSGVKTDFEGILKLKF